MSEYEPTGNFYLDYKHLANGLKRGDPEAVAYLNRKRAERGEGPWIPESYDDNVPIYAALAAVIGAALVMVLIAAFIRFVM